MTDRQPSLEQRLIRIEKAQEEALASTVKLESRLEILRQEFQRTSTSIYRMGLTLESGKASAQRREAALSEIRQQLVRIEAKLAKL